MGKPARGTAPMAGASRGVRRDGGAGPKAAARKAAANAPSKGPAGHRGKRKAADGQLGRGACPPDVVVGTLFSDRTVAAALSDLICRRPSDVQSMMRRWEKPILKVAIPGDAARRPPSAAMLAAAKRAVLRFYEGEESLGPRSAVIKAFYLASGEAELRFGWAEARRRVERARLDHRQEIDSWKDCLAMNSGDTNSDCEIYVCGTRRITLHALTSVLCHEGLHNFARRTRRGNTFLSEDTEHIAMALLGDPQLAS